MSTITFVPTQRGGTALLFDGYRYNKVRCNNDKNVTYWRCSKNRNCPGRAVTVDNRVKKTNNKHNHPPETPLPHHHHALLGHHHHSLHHSLQQQQQQLLQHHHHSLHSSSPNPFLSARHAATAAAAAAIAAASNHHHHQQHHQFGGSGSHHHHHHQNHHQNNHHHHSTTQQQTIDHLQSHSPLSNISASSHHHNLFQQFANAAANSANHQHNHHPHLGGSSPSSHAAVAAITAASAPANHSGHHSGHLSRNQQHSSSVSAISSPPMCQQTSQSLLASANSSGSSSSSGNAFLNQLSDTLRYQQSCLMNNNSSSSANNNNSVDTLQAQLAILSRLGNFNNGPFEGLGNPFKLTPPASRGIISGGSIKHDHSTNSMSGRAQRSSHLGSVHLDNENATAALAAAAAAAAAINSLQSTMESQQHQQQQQSNHNRSSPISSASSSNRNHHNLQHVPTRSASNKAGGHRNDMTPDAKDECDSRSLTLSPSLSPSSVDNDMRTKDGMVFNHHHQLEQMKLLSNHNSSTTSDGTLNNKNTNELRQIFKPEGSNENRQGAPDVYPVRQQATTNNAVEANNASTSSTSPTNFIADYLAGTLKCIFAATGGLSQQQLAALGSSIQAALSGNANFAGSTPITNEATSTTIKMDNKSSSNSLNSNNRHMSSGSPNNSMSLNDVLDANIPFLDRQNNRHDITGNSSRDIDDDTDDFCEDNRMRNEDNQNKIDNDGNHDKNAHLNRLNSFSSSGTVEERNGLDDDYSNDARDYTKNTVDSKYFQNRCSPNSTREDKSPPINNVDEKESKPHPASLDDAMSSGDRVNNIEMNVSQKGRSKRLLSDSFTYKNHGLDLRGPPRHERQQHSHNNHIQSLEKYAFLNNNVSKSRCSINGRHDVIRDSSSSTQSSSLDLNRKKIIVSKVSLDTTKYKHSIYENLVCNEDEEDEDEVHDNNDLDSDDKSDAAALATFK